MKLLVSELISESWCRDCQHQLDDMWATISRYKETNSFWREHWLKIIQQQNDNLKFDTIDEEMLIEETEEQAKTPTDVVHKLHIEKCSDLEEAGEAKEDITDDNLISQDLTPSYNHDHSNTMNCEVVDEKEGHSADDNLVINQDSPSRHNLPLRRRHYRELFKNVQCKNCKQTFLDVKYLHKHRCTVHTSSNNAHPCPKPNCHKSYRTVESLRCHIKRHGEKKLICDQCHAAFHLKKDMITHWHNVHLKLLPVVCERCGHRFKDNYSLRLHAKKLCKLDTRPTMLSERFPQLQRPPVPPVSSRIPLTCAACSRICNSPGTLELHYRKEHPDWDSTSELAKICSKCYRQFDTVEANATHFETVHNRWPCPICKIPLTCQEALDRHMKRHPMDKERPFKCSECGAQFMTMAMLRTHHLRRHTDERPHECPVCRKRFAELPEMRIHQKSHRTDTAPLACPECDQKFAYAKLLRQHIRMRHTDEYNWFTCEKCGDKFINSNLMHAHARVHHPAEFQEEG